MKKIKMWIYLSLAIVGLIVLVPVIITAFTVDNWSRDLTTNVAETSTEHEDIYLQPLQTSVSQDQTIDAIKIALSELPKWELIEMDKNDSKKVVHATRTTSIMRYVDDVTITVEANPQGSLIHMRSASRVGKGDLGQNPRNIKELMSQLRKHAELFEAN